MSVSVLCTSEGLGEMDAGYSCIIYRVASGRKSDQRAITTLSLFPPLLVLSTLSRSFAHLSTLTSSLALPLGED